MSLQQIADDYRVPVRLDGCGDRIIPGANGHLYVDGKAAMVCFTDDGRKKPFPSKAFKTRRLQKLQPWVNQITQSGDYEFTAEIDPEGIRVALFQVLRVKRFKVTKGVPRPPEVQERLRLVGAATAKKRAARPQVMVSHLPPSAEV
jgi:hypothetical protein